MCRDRTTQFQTKPRCQRYFKAASLAAVIGLISFQCSQYDSPPREDWSDRPVSEWPLIVLTNDVAFRGHTYKRLANAFLISAPPDTFAVTAKHLFLVFKHQGMQTISLGDQFLSWQMYPRKQPEVRLEIGEPLNENRSEKTGEFRTLKVRDWLLFRVPETPPEITALKIRERPVEEGELVTAVGFARDQDSDDPALVTMEVFRNPGPYFYVRTLTENVDPAGRSGSPVIDENGHLVGIVSGAEGKLGVIGSVEYLMTILTGPER